MSKTFRKLSMDTKFKEAAAFFEMDVDDFQDLALKYKLDVYPAFLLLNPKDTDKEVVARVTGINPGKLESSIEEALNKLQAPVGHAPADHPQRDEGVPHYSYYRRYGRSPWEARRNYVYEHFRRQPANPVAYTRPGQSAYRVAYLPQPPQPPGQSAYPVAYPPQPPGLPGQADNPHYRNYYYHYHNRY